MNIEMQSLVAVKHFHCKSPKYLQSLPNQANNIGSHVTLGWKLFEFNLENPAHVNVKYIQAVKSN